MRPKALLQRIEGGAHANISFGAFVRLVEACGFRVVRTHGSHVILRHETLGVRLVLQPRHDGDAKPYQIRQFLHIILRYPEETKERL